MINNKLFFVSEVHNLLLFTLHASECKIYILCCPCCLNGITVDGHH